MIAEYVTLAGVLRLPASLVSANRRAQTDARTNHLRPATVEVEHSGPFLLVDRDLQDDRCTVVEVLGRVELGRPAVFRHLLQEVPDRELGVVPDLRFTKKAQCSKS